MVRIICNSNLSWYQKQVYIFQYKYVYTLISARFLGKLKICIVSILNNTVEDGQKRIKKILGEHKVITPEQQFLCIISCFFYVFKMAVAIAFLRKRLLKQFKFLLFPSIFHCVRLTWTNSFSNIYFFTSTQKHKRGL